MAWQILMFASSLALVITVVFIAFHDGLLRLMFGQIEDDVMQAAKTYLIITAISFTGLAVYNSLRRRIPRHEQRAGHHVGFPC